MISPSKNVLSATTCNVNSSEVLAKTIRRLSYGVISLLFFGLLSRRADAYIDPGTTQALWTSLAPILGVIAACLALMLIPLRFAWTHVLTIWRKLPRLARYVVGVLALAAVIGSGMGAVQMFSSRETEAYVHSGCDVTETTYKRVVVLGIDGLDPGRLEQMMSAGDLESFRALRDSGTFARLQTSTPPESPVAWLSAATGMNPGRHGVFDFIGRNATTYMPDLSLFKFESQGAMGLSGQQYAPATDALAFWDILSRAGINTTVVRWPLTFPPPAINGELLSGLGTPDVIGTLGQYSFYTTSPITPEDKAPERVRVVQWNSNTIKTTLSGPAVAALTGRKTSFIPVKIERSGSGQSLAISLGKSAPVNLSRDQWSGWVPIEFPGGLAKDCPAMVRMYLTSIEPDLALYISPLNIDPANPAHRITHPANLSAEWAERIGRFHTLGLPEDTQAVRHGRVPLEAFLKQCEQITEEREAMLGQALDQFDTGLLAIVFDTSDRIQHMCWAATDPSHPQHTPEARRKYGNVIAEHYKRMDKVLGQVMRSVDQDTAVLVMSDHGFTSFERAVHLNTWLVKNGYMTLRDSRDDEGAPLLRNVDWSETRAYAVGFCSLYLNMRGREGKGIVHAGDERRRLLEELSRKLKDWRDPEGWEAVIRNVYRADEIYQGEYVSGGPDLIMGYYPGYRASWQTALGAAPSGDSIVPNNDPWSGDHLVDAPCVPGVFLSNIKCREQKPRLIDIAPTVLKAFDINEEHDMDGRALF